MTFIPSVHTQFSNSVDFPSPQEITNIPDKRYPLTIES